MNTSTVSKILGVSQSTVQRWVKHLDLEMDRNEFGHYIYSEEDVEQLKSFQEQIQRGVPKQEIVTPSKKQRKGKVRETAPLNEKIRELEKKLENKADSVVSYQLLQHRQEIEELKKQLDFLLKKIAKLENQEEKEDLQIPLDRSDKEMKAADEKSKKKGFFSTLFGY